MTMVRNIYPYSSHVRQYLQPILSLLVLTLLESLLVGAAILYFVQSPPLEALLLSILVSMVSFVTVWALAPVYTKHRLEGEELVLRYGLWFRARLPRTWIASAASASHPVETFQAISPRFDAATNRLTLALSEKNQVLLTLDRPHPMRVSLLARRPVREILINVDHRNDLLTRISAEAPAPVPPGGAAALRRRDEAPAARSRVVHAPPAAGVPALEARGLVRGYRGVPVVKGISFAARSGEIYGFLGLNGAGKTTTIKMLTGLLRPEAGRAILAGHDVWSEPDAAKAALGFVPDTPALYERLTPRELARFVAQLRGVERTVAERKIEELFAILDLGDRADSPMGGFSYGMKRKAALAVALVHDPRVVILDEPLNGMDPRSARRFKDLLLDLASRGTCIFLSTHDLATAEELCHRVGVLHRGMLAAEGSVDELRAHLAAHDLEEAFLQLIDDPEATV